MKRKRQAKQKDEEKMKEEETEWVPEGGENESVQ